MNDVIIVAGGSGSRMKSGLLPKQFIEIAGKPVIVHTINRFLKADPAINIIVAVSHDFKNHLEKIINTFFKEQNILIAPGGSNRFESVKNSLPFIKGKNIVAVHDAVRPLADPDFILRCINHAELNKTAVPVIVVSDSLRKKEGETMIPVDRNNYFSVQTPQCFNYQILVNAYEQEFNDLFTDDASVVESAGFALSFVEGMKNNIKITHQEDLQLVEKLLESSN